MLKGIEKVIRAFSLLFHLEEILMLINEQTEALRTLLAQLDGAITEEMNQVNGKLDELKAQLEESRPDLTDLINDVKSSIERVKSIVPDTSNPEAPISPVPEPQVSPGEPSEETPLVEPTAPVVKEDEPKVEEEKAGEPEADVKAGEVDEPSFNDPIKADEATVGAQTTDESLAEVSTDNESPEAAERKSRKK